MSIESALAFIVAFAVVVAIPGPGVMAVVSEGMAKGAKNAWFMVSGVVLGDFTYLTFAMFGLAAVAKTMGEAFVVIKIVAGLYLLYTAYKLWKSSDSFEIENKGANPKGSFLGGLLITLSNPKAIMFYCIFLPNFINLAEFTMMDYLLIVLLDVLVLASVMGGYVYLAVKTGKWAGQKSTKLLKRSASVIMAGLGITILTD